MSLGGSPLASGALRERVLGATLMAALLALLVAPGLVFSQPWLPNGAPVCTADSDQTTTAIVSDGGGGVITVWQDYRNGNYDIYAQRVDASGVVQWTADGVAICTTDSSQLLPQIIDDGSGGAIVAWQDYRNGNYDIYAQRVNSSGEAQWTADGIPICTAVFDQVCMSMVSDGLGGAILTWEDNRSNVVDCPDIYAQRVDPNGVGLWTADGVSVCNEANAQHGPRLTSDGSGGAFITWYDQRAGDYDIYTQRVASGGAVQWTTNGVATCTMGTDQLKPDICSDGADGVIITWYDYRATTDFNIYAQRVGPSGAIVWVVDGVVMNNNVAYDQINPRIVSDGLGGAIITWQDYVTGTTSDIYAQRVAAAGEVLWTATGVTICTAAGDQMNPRIVTDGNSGAYITWDDHRDTANCDVYAQRIAADAALNWPATGYLVCGADSNQTDLAMASDGNFGAVVAWQDYRNGNWDIYAQGFDVSGAPDHHDVGCTKILAPTGIIDTNQSVTPACTLYNYGTSTESYRVRLKVGGFYDDTACVTDHTPGTHVYVTFPADSSWPRGPFAVTCSTELTGDGVHANDRATDSVDVQVVDVGCSVLLTPLGTIDSGTTVTPACTLYNYGTGSQDYRVRMRIGSFYSDTAFLAGQTKGTAVYVTFPQWTVTQIGGPYAVVCSTELAGDAQTANDRQSGAVLVVRPVRDVGVLEIIQPVDTVDTGAIVVPAAVVRNLGVQEETFPVRFSIGSFYTADTSVTVGPGVTDTVSFRDWVVVEIGTHAVRCSTMLDEDQNNANDLAVDTVVVPSVGIGQTENSFVPLAFALYQSRPNPLVRGTFIQYALPRPAPVEVRIYSAAGTLVRRLVGGGQAAGYRHAYWNGCDDQGRSVAPGVYYCRFRAGEFRAAQKLVVQR